MTVRIGTILLCIIATALTCPAQQVNLDQGVASEILKGVTASQVAGALSENQQLLLNYRIMAIEQAIAQEASQMGLTERLDVQNALQQSRRQILVQARKDELARTIQPASENDMKKLYKEQPELWTLPTAYQLDVLELDKTDERSLRKAKRLESGEVIPDDKLTGLKARVVVTQASQQWLPRNLIAPNIWAQLPTMDKDTVRLFETGDATLLIRRGEYREEALLSYDQVRGNIVRYLQGTKSNDAWNEYLLQKRAELGL